MHRLIALDHFSYNTAKLNEIPMSRIDYFYYADLSELVEYVLMKAKPRAVQVINFFGKTSFFLEEDTDPELAYVISLLHNRDFGYMWMEVIDEEDN